MYAEARPQPLMSGFPRRCRLDEMGQGKRACQDERGFERATIAVSFATRGCVTVCCMKGSLFGSTLLLLLTVELYFLSACVCVSACATGVLVS